MVRPLKAINKVWEKWRRCLQRRRADRVSRHAPLDRLSRPDRCDCAGAMVGARTLELADLDAVAARALYDVMQSHHSLRRNYPLIARIRWLFRGVAGPFLYAYVVESPLDGRPFARNERDLVYARAKGQLDSHP